MKLLYAVFEPIKYSLKTAPVQVLIQLRTWGKATHVGMIMNPDRVYTFIENNKLQPWNREELINLFPEVGSVISAVFPTVKVQNIFEDYIGDRVYLKEVEVTEYQKDLIWSYWAHRLNKEGYSLIGLLWFLGGPFFDIFRKDKTKEPDPQREFCSEAATNSLYQAGIKVFSFEKTFEEDIKLKAYRTKTFDEFRNSLTEEEILYLADRLTEEYYQEVRNNKTFYGFKISPRVFSISPVFRDIGYFEITKDKVVFKLK